MAERTSVTQVVQFGDETTPGTSVNADRKLPSVALNFGVQASFTEVRASGYKFPTLEVLGKEWTSIKAPAQPTTYDEIVFFLSSLLSYAAPVQQGATDAYLWTHNVDSDSEDTIKTFTIEQGSSLRAHKAVHCQAIGMTIGGDRDKLDFSCDMIGRALSDGITLTSTPTVIPQVPMLAKDVSIYCDTAYDDIGTTKLTRALSWELSLSNKVGPLWVVDKAQTSFVTTVEMPIDASLKFMVEANSDGMAHLAAMRSSDRQFFRVEIESDTEAGTAYPYSCVIDLAGEIAEQPSEFSDKDGVYAIEFTYKLVHDSDLTRALGVTVTNTQTSL